MLPARLEGSLFAALDGEADGRIAAQLEAALRTLLRAGAGAEPGRWLTACTRVSLAVPARVSGTGGAPPHAPTDVPAGCGDCADSVHM